MTNTQWALIALVLGIITGILVACGQVGPPRATDNPTVEVNLLFEYDGCKVYRFLDWATVGGEYAYYSDCRGGPRIQ